jgi:hypothetical protein
MTDPAGGETILPVHTRIAMGKEAARRLYVVLGQVLSQAETQENVPEIAKAQLPKMQ